MDLSGYTLDDLRGFAETFQLENYEHLNIAQLRNLVLAEFQQQLQADVEVTEPEESELPTESALNIQAPLVPQGAVQPSGPPRMIPEATGELPAVTLSDETAMYQRLPDAVGTTTIYNRLNDIGVFPPPLERVTAPASDIDPSIPGAIHTDPSGELLKTFFAYHGLGGNNVMGYNNFITNRIPKIMASRTLYVNDGVDADGKQLSRVVHFTNPLFVVPSTQQAEQDISLTYPRDALDLGVSYSAQLYANAVVIDQDGQLVEKIDHIMVGIIPVMTGSVLDNARTLTDEQKLKRGLDPHDIDGYFIINGTKKVILIQEKLRLDLFSTYPADNCGNVVTKMTSETIYGTTINEIRYDEKRGVLMYRYGIDTKTDMINALVPFKLLGELLNNGVSLDVNQIFAFITPFIRDEHLHSVWLKLQNTFADLATVTNSVKHLSDLKGMKNIQQWRKLKSQIEREGDTVEDIDEDQVELRLAAAALEGRALGSGKKRNENLKNVATTMRNIDESQQKDLLQKDMLRTLFPQINLESNEQNVRVAKKLYMLGMMIARFGQYLAGIRELDDRDDVGNKRYESAGRMMEPLFRSLWTKQINILQETINKPGRSPARLANTIKGLDNQLMTKIFNTSFSSTRWGMRRSDPNTVTDILKEASLSEKAAYLTKISTPTAKEVKKPEVRMVNPSQLGYICPVETPEGMSCGLIKHAAIAMRQSIDTGDGLTRKELRDFITLTRSVDKPTVCLLDGILLGWCNGDATTQHMIGKRRSRSIPEDTCVYHEEKFRELLIFTKGGRATRPLLIAVMGGDGLPELVIKQKKLFGADYDTLLREGAVEYVDALEQRKAYIAMSIEQFDRRRGEVSDLRDELQQMNEMETYIDDEDDLYQIADEFQTQMGTEVNFNTKEDAIIYVKHEIKIIKLALDNLIKSSNYTHCELDPTAILGVSANLVPLSDHNQGPRNIYQASMGKQALGVVSSSISQEMSNIKTLTYPTRPTFATQASKWLGMDELPAGQNVIVLFGTFPWNQEDAVIVDQHAVDAGLFRYTVYHVHKANNYTQATGVKEVFRKPETIPKGKEHLYEAIDDNGLPMIGAKVREGDCIISKIREVTTDADLKIHNASTFLPIGIEGVVDRVVVSVQENVINVKVKIRQTRAPVRGDKVASRHAQKSTIGRVVPHEDMPRTEDGVVPSVIINAMAIPSRMTIGMLDELVASKAAVMYNEHVDATAFRNFSREGGSLEMLQRMLHEYGFNDEGYQDMYSGTSGKLFTGRMFIGPVYYQVLKHLVQYKYGVRGAMGSVSLLTRQPVPGRQHQGGLRFGEMERDSEVAHGASALLRGFLCMHSDPHTSVYCQKCGIRATYRFQAGEFTCLSCGTNDQLGQCTGPYSQRPFEWYLAGFGLRVINKVVPKTDENDA